MLVFLLALNITVSTRQVVNYKLKVLKIPLYLKLLDFFDRDFNYKLLAKNILGGSKTDKERVMKLFAWAHENIRKTPAGFPITDNHVWNIIVRGYGESDQASDVFTTLCNYASIDAFFTWLDIGPLDNHYIPLSFVKIEGRWSVFDPRGGFYFMNKKNEFAGIDEIAKGDWSAVSLDGSGASGVFYAEYLKNLELIKNVGLTRANTQSPINRLRLEIKKLKFN